MCDCVTLYLHTHSFYLPHIKVVNASVSPGPFSSRSFETIPTSSSTTAGTFVTTQHLYQLNLGPRGLGQVRGEDRAAINKCQAFVKGTSFYLLHVGTLYNQNKNLKNNSLNQTPSVLRPFCQSNTMKCLNSNLPHCLEWIIKFGKDDASIDLIFLILRKKQKDSVRIVE